MKFITGLFLILISSLVLAQENILINEIMYDNLGSDSGKEWVEIYNKGNESINLSNWKFYEAETKHKLSLINGSLIINSNSYAVIADNSDIFLANNPNFNGTLFDSVFSLSNSGEYLALYNGTNFVDEVNYNNSWGGNGGYSLELNDFNLDNNNESNWNTSIIFNGTPGEINSMISVCSSILVNTSFTEWFNQTTCLLNNTYLQNRSLTQYDQNNCGIENITYYEFQILDCDYCLPNWNAINTTCQDDDSIIQWYNDTNSCYEQTNLSSDLESKPENNTFAFICDYNNDSLIGNVSDINTSLTNLNIEKNNSIIRFKENNLIILELNLTNNIINLANITIIEQNNESNFSFLIINGLNIENKTKIIYLDNINTSIDSVCIDDSEILSVDEISSDCGEENETLLTCDGSDKDGYSCSEINNGSRYKITGLRHSGVREQDSPEAPTSNMISSGGGGGSRRAEIIVLEKDLANETISLERDNPTKKTKIRKSIKINEKKKEKNNNLDSQVEITLNKNALSGNPMVNKPWWSKPKIINTITKKVVTSSGEINYRSLLDIGVLVIALVSVIIWLIYKEKYNFV